MNNFSLTEINEKISERSKFVADLKKNMSNVVSGQSELINKLIIAMLADGHILLEGLPGLAKTLMVKTLSNLIKTDFQRIQFTPDMLPADLLGTLVYNQKTGEFDIRKGPIFSNIILADEINRSPAKVQSALLEAMQERQITIGEETFLLDKPFLVMATQNPIEQEGTYPLPEAQVDRFMLKVVLPYPNREEEKLIVRANVSTAGFEKPNKVVDPKQIVRAREVVKQIYMDEKIEKYIVDIVYATREPEYYQLDKVKHYISFGGSPRASISLANAAKSYAFLKKRGYVIPEDVRAVCKDVLRHRIGLSYEAEAENVSTEDVITTILNTVEVP